MLVQFLILLGEEIGKNKMIDCGMGEMHGSSQMSLELTPKIEVCLIHLKVLLLLIELHLLLLLLLVPLSSQKILLASNAKEGVTMLENALIKSHW